MRERWEDELEKLGRLQPSAGLWEQARQGPRRDLSPSHETGRLVGAVVALLVVSLAGYGLWSAFGGDIPSSPGFSSSTKQYRNAKFGWTVIYPSRMKFGHFQSSGLFDSDGAWIGTFQANTSASQVDLEHLRKGFPADGVLFQLWWGQRFPIPSRYIKPDDPLPLTLASFRPVRPYSGGNEPQPLYRTFWEGGRVFNAAAWIGPQASEADRAAISAIVGSIDFPGSVRPPSGFHLLFPQQAGPPTEGDPNGGATLTIATNLPDGTIVLVGYDAGAAREVPSAAPLSSAGSLSSRSETSTARTTACAIRGVPRHRWGGPCAHRRCPIPDHRKLSRMPWHVRGSDAARIRSPCSWSALRAPDRGPGDEAGSRQPAHRHFSAVRPAAR